MLQLYGVVYSLPAQPFAGDLASLQQYSTEQNKEIKVKAISLENRLLCTIQ